ncbi:Chaperone DnaJ-domain superfamily protein, putative isoform 2 [Hibiscus syriacus]|uniref:Chaperone DnaJ-domain superfamily protein, putative isoform 2 n=1 Tax=Hibiscus syriacus TaxID=106335 RepID=A0A6A2XGM1_HIBSY|nr:Chaperone DnaJ-domain superfamily protein, putative isoform 2 [Hibiscus syriacus]
MENLSHSETKKWPGFFSEAEDYTEIFGGFHASRGVSIPVLNLPLVDDNDEVMFDARNPRFNYGEVFSRFQDYAGSYEELMRSANGGDDHACDGGFSDEACNGDQSNGVTQLHDPGYTCILENPLQNTDDENPPLHVTDDISISTSLRELQRKTAWKELYINLRTEPSHVPPPSRPPPLVNGESGYYQNGQNAPTGGRMGLGSPPFFNVEIDASSTDVASAAAMKEAMDKTQVNLKNAKEVQERKREGTKSCIKLGSKSNGKVEEKASKAVNGKKLVEADELGKCEKWLYVQEKDNELGVGPAVEEKENEQEEKQTSKRDIEKKEEAARELEESERIWRMALEQIENEKRVKKARLQEYMRENSERLSIRMILKEAIEQRDYIKQLKEVQDTEDELNQKVVELEESEDLKGEMKKCQDNQSLGDRGLKFAFEWRERARQPEAAKASELGKGSVNGTFQQVKIRQSAERKGKNIDDSLASEDEAERRKRERELENERLRTKEEEREREREKDRMAADRTALEAHERAERAALERATAEARQRAMAEAHDRLEKACAEAREKSSVEVRLEAERAAVERENAEAREHAVEKAMAERAAFEARERVERSMSDKVSSSSRHSGLTTSFSSSRTSTFGGLHYLHASAYNGVEGEPAQRCKARLERHQRTAERAAKALEDKNMIDLIAQREQAERNRLAETVDADVKRWSGNLSSGPESGWQPIPLTEVITSGAVMKEYRKATLCVRPDKLQQRGASIQHKYICEKVFDLLKVVTRHQDFGRLPVIVAVGGGEGIGMKLGSSSPVLDVAGRSAAACRQKVMHPIRRFTPMFMGTSLTAVKVARQHIRNFLEVCDSFCQQGEHEEVLKLKLFLYSMHDRASAWLSGVPAGSIESWTDLCKNNLMRYSPPNMNTQLRNDIASFYWIQEVMFYNGVNAPTMMMLDASANGTLLDKSPAEAFDILDRIAINVYQFPSTRLRVGRKSHGAFELDSKDSLSAQLAAITNMLKNLQRPSEVREVKVGQIVVTLRERIPRHLPSDTEVSKTLGKEQCSVLTLRSGTQINVEDKFGGRPKDDSPPETVQAEQEVQEEAPVEEDKNEGSSSKETEGANKNAKATFVNTPSVQEVRPSPPFPQRLKKHNEDIQFRKFVDILSQLQINVPFLEAMKQMPTYSKFLKEIVTKKRKVEYFIIPCSIGDKFVGKALCDLGFSVNLMPKSIFVKLGIGNARPIFVILQLADRSHVRPEGRVEDVIVRVNKFIFPVDFMILDCEVDATTPIILGRPFLATDRILIDCERDELTIRVVDQHVTVNVFRSLKYMDDSEECQSNLEHAPTLELKNLPHHLKYAYLGYNQIVVVLEDQEKTTFTCPYGTYAFRRMPFGLCNALTTFQHCMQAIFSYMVEDFLDILMDDFSVSGDDFQKMPRQFGKGHKISAKGIEVDKAKIEDFSTLSKPLCTFVFDQKYHGAFKDLRKRLISVPIVVPPDWTTPFELMCDASDFSVGAVLGQRRDEVSNREVKKILEKVVNPRRKDWSPKLDEALWDYRMKFKTPLGMSPFNMGYRKACHLPFELEHKAYWAIKKLNFDAQLAGEKRLLDLNEMEEFRALKLFPGKLKSRWSGSFKVHHVYPYGAVDIKNMDNGSIFKVNGQRLKAYQGEEDDAFGSEVLDVVNKHKWQKVSKHPATVNASIVKEFYSNISEPNQHAVMVLEDLHVTFAQDADNETYQGILEDLYFPDTRWNDQQMSRRTVVWEKLLSQKVPEEQFDEILLGITRITTEKIPMLLGLKGEKGKENEVTISRVSSSPHARANSDALEQAIQCTQEHIGQLSEKLMTYFAYAKRRDEFFTNAFLEFLPHMNFTVPDFPKILLPPNEDVEESTKVPHPATADAPQSPGVESPQPAKAEEPTDPDLVHVVSTDAEREANLQLAYHPESPQFVEPLAAEHPDMPQPTVPMEEEHPEVPQPIESTEESQSEMPRQAPLHRSRCRLKKASKREDPQLSTVPEGPSTPPAATASDFEHSSLAKLRKRPRRATAVPPPA